jgi:hypothetical protein
MSLNAIWLDMYGDMYKQAASIGMPWKAKRTKVFCPRYVRTFLKGRIVDNIMIETVEVIAVNVKRIVCFGILLNDKLKLSSYKTIRRTGIESMHIDKNTTITFFCRLMDFSIKGRNRDVRFPNPYKAVQKNTLVRSKKNVI